MFFQIIFCENYLSQIEQACGFSPVWISFCVFKCTFCENALSPVCIMCSQVRLQWECLVTFWARMWLFPSVNQFMCFQIFLSTRTNTLKGCNLTHHGSKRQIKMLKVRFTLGKNLSLVWQVKSVSSQPTFWKVATWQNMVLKGKF